MLLSHEQETEIFQWGLIYLFPIKPQGNSTFMQPGSLAVLSFGNNNMDVILKVIAEIWECGKQSLMEQET